MEPAFRQKTPPLIQPNSRFRYFKLYLLFPYFIFQLIGFSVSAKNINVDSLIHAFENHNEDAQKVQLALDLFYEYLTKDVNKARAYAQNALELSERLNYKKGIAQSLSSIGDVYQYWGDYKLSMSYYLKSIKINKEIDFKMGISNDYNSLGVINDFLGKSKKALKYYNLSFALKEKLNDKKGMAVALNNMAIVYSKDDESEKVLRCFFKAMTLYEEIDDELRLSDVYNNLGEEYIRTGKLNDAIDFANKGLVIKEKIRDLRGTSSSLSCLGNAYLELHEFDKAENALKKSIALARQIDSKYHEYNNLLSLSDLYERQGKLTKALEYYKEHVEVKEQLLNDDNLNKVSQLQSRYETEEKEQQITILNQEKILQASQLENKSLMEKLLYGAIAMILLFTFFGFRYTKIKQDSKRLVLNQQLKIEKEEAERLQELDKLKGHFFSNIAHEFRTPLTLILGPLEHVIDEIKSKSHKEQLGLVKSNASKLLRLINQLLDLSRLESGIIKLEPVQDDIISFLKGITYSFHSLAEQKRIDLSFQSSENKLLMDFDKDKTEKILLNLLSNAFKFTPNFGSIYIAVEKLDFFKGKEEDHLKVTVKDSGAGIPENELSKVFNRFYQADNSQVREVEGSGIGLALTKELVEVQNGVIEVLSGQEKGAAFAFYLPIKNEAPIVLSAPEADFDLQTDGDFDENLISLEISQPRNPVLSVPADDHTSREIVLVIEDNEDVRRFISGSLKQTYKIIEATDGEEGFALAKLHIPDLIISDVMMPKMDGYETCKALKNNEITSHIPVILLTAKAGIESKLEGLETGADDYLPKPFNTKELKVRMKNLIRLRRNLREKYLQNALLENHPSPIAPKEDIFLRKIREIVEVHLEEEEFSVEDLSGELAMSRTQVHRKLKALTNQSASQFMRMIRLQHAQTLLKEGINNVSEVAYKVGFSSPNYFSTCFTEFYGYAPSEQKNVG